MPRLAVCIVASQQNAFHRGHEHSDRLPRGEEQMGKRLITMLLGVILGGVGSIFVKRPFKRKQRHRIHSFLENMKEYLMKLSYP